MANADILVSPATVYYAPVGETIPDRDSVGYGAAWGGNWTKIAWTKTPLSMNRDASTYTAMIEQSTLGVKRTVVEDSVRFETVLAEFFAASLQLGMEGTAQTVAAGVGTVGYEELLAGGEFKLTERAWGFEGLLVSSADDDLPVRVFILRATAVLNGQITFGKGDSVGIPLRIDALGDLSQAVGEQLMIVEKTTAVALP